MLFQELLKSFPKATAFYTPPVYASHGYAIPSQHLVLSVFSNLAFLVGLFFFFFCMSLTSHDVEKPFHVLIDHLDIFSLKCLLTGTKLVCLIYKTSLRLDVSSRPDIYI